MSLDHPDPLDQIPRFGQYKRSGATWHDILAQDPDYVRWVVEEADNVSVELRSALEDALADL